MLVLLLGAGTGLENGARSNLPNDDLSSIWIQSRFTSLPFKGLAIRRKITFEQADLAAIRQHIPGVKYLSAMIGRNAVNTVYKNKVGSFNVNGVANEFFLIRDFTEQRSGRRINALDEAQSRKVALIGTKVKQALFPQGEEALGRSIALNGVMVTVVGVFYDSGARGRANERIYLPMSTFQGIFGSQKAIGQIVLVPQEQVDPFQFERNVVSLLKERHRVAPEDTRGITSTNLSKFTQDISDLFSAITAFSWFVGIGTLSAGVVGISNIMIITVSDRTREIGIRKALGATPWSIINMIVAESILLTAFAGYLGLVAGVAVLEGAAVIFAKMGSEVQQVFINPEVDMVVALQMLMLLIFLGALAGFAPAMRAAKITPIAAMREEH